MKIKLLFHGEARERTGENMVHITVSRGSLVSDMQRILPRKFPAMKQILHETKFVHNNAPILHIASAAELLHDGDTIRVFAEPKHPLKTLESTARHLRKELADDEKCPAGSIEQMSAQVSFDESMRELDLAKSWDSPQKLKMNSNEVKCWLSTRANPLVQLEVGRRSPCTSSPALFSAFTVFMCVSRRGGGVLNVTLCVCLLRLLAN